jgi:cytochrome c-type biogenesis protein
MADWFQEQALSGSLVLAIPVAAVAGLISFFSPCVLPLVPGYLSYATGLTGADLVDAGVTARHRGRLVLGSLLFVLGFAAVFVVLGVTAGFTGELVIEWQREVNLVLGVVSILLGLAFVGLVPVLQREWRVHAVPAVGLGAAPMLGALFAFGWIPCVGPTLAVIFTLAEAEGSAGRGGLLLGCYAAGLGIPFVVAGAAYQRMLGAIRFVRRHQRWVVRLGGALMILVGLALVTGWWDVWVRTLQIHLVGGFEVTV